MELYAVIRKKYDITGKIINLEVFDSDNDIGVLLSRAKKLLKEESNLSDFRGFSLSSDGFKGEFKSQDLLNVVYTDGLFRSYSIVDVNTSKKIRVSYEDQLAEVVGNNLISHETRCCEIKEANIATYYLQNKYTNNIHALVDVEEIGGIMIYTALCGSKGSHLNPIYQDSSNEIDCQLCLDLQKEQ